ncbi:MAG: molecular chaperone TorD family protein [Raoultibacter sp.]
MKHAEAVVCAATLFSRLDETAYTSITDDAFWNEILTVCRSEAYRNDYESATEKHTMATTSAGRNQHYAQLTKPPSYCEYRQFANRILTPGIPGHVAPIESLYVPWTEMPGSEIGNDTGRYLSDRALHIMALCDQLAIEIPPTLRDTPDHLTLLCELWAFLDEHAPACDARAFAHDHGAWLATYRTALDARFDNIPDETLKKTLGFYQDLIDLVMQMMQPHNEKGEQREAL